MEECMCGHFIQEIKNVIISSLHFHDNFFGGCYWQKHTIGISFCWFLIIDKKVSKYFKILVSFGALYLFLYGIF